jgi:hypothetical protein
MANSLTISNSGVSSITLSDAPLFTPNVYGSSSVVLPGLNTLASIGNAVTGTSAITLPILISSGVSGAVNGTSSITLSALLSSASSVAGSGSITLNPVNISYTPGGNGIGPTLGIGQIAFENTTVPYEVFIATHQADVTLSPEAVIAGTDANILDALTFQDDDGTVTGQELTLTGDMTDGYLSLVVRDSSDPEVVSNVIRLTDVDVDATAATLSSPVATQTGATTADWSITSNEAAGVVYAGVRPTASAALTSPQLIAGSGGAGVAWSTDTTMTADANNGGTFTGLTAETAYRVDYVAVDDWGNVGSVVSSAEFTTAAPPVLSFSYIGTATDLDAQASYTFTDADIATLDFTSGGQFLVQVLAHESTNTPNLATPTGVTIGGITATEAAPFGGYPTPDAAISATSTAWIATVAGGATEEIVITSPTTPSAANWSGVSIAVYRIDGYAVRDVVTNWALADGNPLTLDTQAGSPVLLGVIFDDAPGVTNNLNVDASLGTPDASGNVAFGEEWGVYSDDAAAATGDTLYSFSTVNGNIRYALTLVALEAA